MDRWVCPNDRQLALRAKLGTGWSFFTNRSANDHDHGISNDELYHIADVLRQKEMFDRIEKDRIGHMVVHLQNIKENPSQHPRKNCHICGHCVILFSSSFSNKICGFCDKTTCDDCMLQMPAMSPFCGASDCSSVEEENAISPTKLFGFLGFSVGESKQKQKICKYCLEIREIWKRSGAWQHNQIPDYNLPDNVSVCPHPDSCSKVITNPSSAKLDSASWESYRRPPKWSLIRDGGETDSAADEISITEAAFERFSFNPFEECDDGNMKGKVDSDVFKPNEVSVLQKEINNHTEKEQETIVLPYHQEPPVGSLFWSRDSIKKPKRKCKEESLGVLQYKVLHNSSSLQLIITIESAKDLKAMDNNGYSDPYVKCHLLPGNTHKTKLRTKTCYKTLNPVWNESLIYHGITRSDVDSKTLRLAVLDEDTIGFDWIGEYRLYLADLNSDEEYIFLHNLLPRQRLSKGSDDLIDHERGKILISLLYDDKNRNLHVTIIRCAELAPMDCNGFSDPFCKIYLKPDRSRNTKRKTQTKKMTLNPYYNEEFIIELESNWVRDKTLEISVWDYDRGPTNDFIGGVKFHYKAKGDRGKLWRTVNENPNKKFEGWFILCADLSEVD